MPRSYSAREILSWSKNGRPVPGATSPDLFSADQLDAFQRSLNVDTREMAEDLAIQALQQQIVQAKQEVIIRESARSGGVAPIPTVVIDGMRDAPLSAVKPDSLILIDWNYLPEVAVRTWDALQQRSPKREGNYIAGLLTYIDSAPVNSGPISLMSSITTETKEVSFVASVPYARRLEVGKDSQGRPWVKVVAPHIVEETAIVARRLFSDLAIISYQYVDLSNPFQLSKAGMHARHFEGGKWRVSSTPRTRRGQLETTVRYPSILIRPLE
jgi:hypothetical protein